MPTAAPCGGDERPGGDAPPRLGEEAAKVGEREAKALVLDIGAGKALFTRAIYEALGRSVAVVALDSRKQSKRDRFYDPLPRASTSPSARAVEPRRSGEGGEGKVAAGATRRSPAAVEAPYTRIVADVKSLASKTLVPLRDARGGGVVAVTKHLCGGATDESLVALCVPPLDAFVGACCLAPCCHQKTTREQVS